MFYFRLPPAVRHTGYVEGPRLAPMLDDVRQSADRGSLGRDIPSVNLSEQHNAAAIKHQRLTVTKGLSRMLRPPNSTVPYMDQASSGESHISSPARLGVRTQPPALKPAQTNAPSEPIHKKRIGTRSGQS